MEIQESSLPLFYLSRVLGLAPYTLKRSNRGRIESIQLSYWLCGYSVAILLTAVPLMFRFLLIDSHSRNPIRMRSSTSNFVTICDVLILVGVSVCGIVSGIMRLNNVRELNRKLSEADKDLVLFNDHGRGRKRGIVLLAMVSFLTSGVLFLDLFSKQKSAKKLWRTGDRIYDEIYIVTYIPFYVLYFIMMGEQMQFAQTVVSIAQRYQCLNMEFKSAFSLTAFTTLPSNSSLMRSSNVLDRLSYTYTILGESMCLISASYGLTLLALLVSCLLHLVASAYFLFVELLGDADAFVASTQFLWLCFNLTRLLLIVEPCHMTAVEAGNTIVIVSDMLRNCKDSTDECILKRFWRQLQADKMYVISACGMCRIDRKILTTMGGAIATYLVIFIQFQKTDG